LPKKPKTTPSVPSENPYFIYGLLLCFEVLVFIFASYKVTGDDDFFWHLATGRFIIENKYVPDKDVFGHVTQGTDWIPFEWGWDVFTYGLYNIGGYNLILVFRSLVFTLIFLLFFLLLRRFKVNSVVMFVVLSALLFAIIDRLSPRPHILTYLFLVLVIYILASFRYLDRQRYVKKLYFLPLIFLVWSNTHMGVLAGGLVLFVFTLSEIIIYFNPRKFAGSEIKPLSGEELKKLSAISVVCALMLLVNPHFIQTYLYAYSHTKMKLLETVNEWRSPWDPFFGTGFVTTLYKIFLYSGLLILIYAYIKRDLTFALIYIAFLIYSVRAIRFTVDYEIVITFFLAVSLNYFALRAFHSKALGSIFRFLLQNNSVKVALSAAAVVVMFMIPSGQLYQAMRYYRVFGFGINGEFLPLQLIDFMKRNNIRGTPFNHFGTGGLLVWNFPGEKNFLDSRNLNDEIFYEYNGILNMRPGFEKKLESRGVDYVIYLDPDLVRRPNELKQVIVAYLCAHPDEWKLVFWDDKSFLFLKNLPKFQETIDKFDYQILNPYNALFQQKQFEKLVVSDPNRTKEEFNRKVKEEPDGFLVNGIGQSLNKILK
jgi:hypothetical protein